MIVVPTSDIILLKNPIEIDYMNELTFNSLNDQYNYFHSLQKLECENATYVRKDEVIRFPTRQEDNITFDDVIKFNYCMYKNSAWSNKWFYAFIKDVKFENDGMCLIEIETDVWQTWMFDITFKNSFIEREHVNDDTIGKHTIPEGLELGEYVIQEKGFIPVYPDELSGYYIILGVTIYPITQTGGMEENAGGHIYGGVYTGIAYITGENISDVENIIKYYQDRGKIDAIQSVFLAPKSLCQNITWVTVVGWSYYVKYGIIGDSNDEFGFSTLPISKPTTLGNNYDPTNKKLLTWPYCYLNVDNNIGNCIDYHYEDFPGNNFGFDIMGTLTPGCSYKISPTSYKGIIGSYLYSFTPCKLPICNWQNDLYINYMTQQGVNTGLGIVGSAISLVTSGITGNPIGIASGILAIANTMGQVYEHSIIPPSVKGNLNSNDVNFPSNLVNPIYYKMCIKEEYAKIIDKYFSMYGYKVNALKLPNITGRTNWNYIKTIGCNIIGDIPQKDLEKIKEIFNNGVTLWHNPSTFLDYSQTNNIVT